MTEPMIAPFKGPFRFLSNFYPSPTRLDGTRYPTVREFFGGRTIDLATVEHGYQAGKSDDPAEQDRILHPGNPGHPGQPTRSHPWIGCGCQNVAPVRDVEGGRSTLRV